MLEKIKEFVKRRDIGFWVSLGIVVLMTVMTIIYPVYFYFSQYWESNVLVFLIVGLVLAAGLFAGGLFFKPLQEYVPAALGIGLLIAVLFFFSGSWLMIQDAVGGYESRGFIDGFWQFVVLAIICLVASIVNIVVLRQVKNNRNKV
jgi:hypothetical protein